MENITATKYRFLNIHLSTKKYNELYNMVTNNIDEIKVIAKIKKFYDSVQEIANYIDDSKFDISVLFYMPDTEFELFCNSSIPYLIKEIVEDVSEYKLNNWKYDKIILPRIIIVE